MVLRGCQWVDSLRGNETLRANTSLRANTVRPYIEKQYGQQENPRTTGGGRPYGEKIFLWLIILTW